MNVTLIYHRSDSDGLLSEAIARQDLARHHKVTSIGWDYGDPVPDVAGADRVWMVDISVDELLKDDEVRKKCVIHDHHKTLDEKFGRFKEEFELWGYDVRFAGCRLVYACCNGYELDDGDVQSPHLGEDDLVFLIGLRDVWKHEGTEHEQTCQRLELGMRAEWPPDFEGYLECGVSDQLTWLDDKIKAGAVMERYEAAQSKEAAERGAMVVELGGLKFLALNTLMRGSRLLDTYSREMLGTMPHDALMVWGVGKDKGVVMSLYHAPHRKDVDLSVIAKGFGGGGHAGACGCRMNLEAMRMVLDDVKGGVMA